MSEKISMELWHSLRRLKDDDKWVFSKFETSIWVKIYDNDGNPLGGVAVRLYATELSAPPHEEEIAIYTHGRFNDSELGMVISRDNGETEPILVERNNNSSGGLLVEAVIYNPPLYNEKSFWYVSFKNPDSIPYKRGDRVYTGWEIYGDRQRFIGPFTWKAVRQWKIEASIEKIVKEIGSDLTNQRKKTSQSYDNISANMLEMRTAAEQIDADFTERAFAPFWDSICGFAVKIGCLETEMRSIAQCYREYEKLYGQYLKNPDLRYLREGDPKPSPFMEEWLHPMHPKMLKQITDWFRTTVRKGQTDFQFASIYEHYRTRDVLVEGFRDLVKKFTDISNVLDSVNRSLINGFRELNECMSDLQECIGNEFEYLRECIEEEEKSTRQVIHDEGQNNRQLIAVTTAASEILRQKRHKELLDAYESQQEANREAMEEEFEYLRDSIEEEGESVREFAEEVEDRRQERQRELLATYEYEQEAIRETLADGLDRNEAGQQDRHEEVISEGKRDRELIKDIDKHVGGKEWYRS